MNTKYIEALIFNAPTVELLRLEDNLSRATAGHVLRCGCLTCRLAIEINIETQKRADYSFAVGQIAAYIDTKPTSHV